MLNPLIRLLDDADVMPHGICFAWRPDLVILHAGSDLVITAAYFIIPLALVGLVRQRTDIRHGWMLYTFAAFILLCGITHAANIYVLWVPDYGLQGLVKVATATVSIATAFALWTLVPKLVALPTQQQLIEANERLSHEIAEREAAEVRLVEQAKELARSNEELERFAYVASHDLRAPLRGIRSVIGWLEEDLGEDLDADSREKMMLIRSRTDRLDRMLTDLLNYSRIGHGDSTAEEFDAGRIIRDSFDELNVDSRFTLELPADVPTLFGRQLGFQQVVANLIGNAIKHHDRPNGTLTIAVETQDDRHVFAVSDDGPGIPEKYHKRIFRMFETLTARDTKDTTGMGLSIIKKIVEGEGGMVWIESSGPQRGTTFRFTWPRKRLVEAA
ncbi:ATP-binding protein [Thalassobaculum sp.]|uniref:sensor histidine kinase n=1 Tax=Thalassobaculum sp. TaxID=2022740 RepID=UPI0032EC9D18